MISDKPYRKDVYQGNCPANTTVQKGLDVMVKPVVKSKTRVCNRCGAENAPNAPECNHCESV
jgi:hypothetical protein